MKILRRPPGSQNTSWSRRLHFAALMSSTCLNLNFLSFSGVANLALWLRKKDLYQSVPKEPCVLNMAGPKPRILGTQKGGITITSFHLGVNYFHLSPKGRLATWRTTGNLTCFSWMKEPSALGVSMTLKSTKQELGGELLTPSSSLQDVNKLTIWAVRCFVDLGIATYIFSDHFTEETSQCIQPRGPRMGGDLHEAIRNDANAME